MARSLKSGCIRRCSFSSCFRLDAFRYFFEGKGTRPSFGQGKNYEKHDFDQKFFPSNWDKVYDHLGDGCMVQYPIRICSKLKWSPLVYHKDGNGMLVPKPRTFSEVIMVHVVKKTLLVLYMSTCDGHAWEWYTHAIDCLEIGHYYSLAIYMQARYETAGDIADKQEYVLWIGCGEECEALKNIAKKRAR